MSIYLDGEYARRHPDYHVEDSPWRAEQIVKMLELEGLHPGTVCEVGCGAGEILRQLWLRMPPDTQFTGYDISPHAIELCRARANDRLEFALADLTAEQLDTPFDVLLCVDVLEHVDDYLGFLRSLRPKAHLKIFHIPLDLSAQTLIRVEPIMGMRRDYGHLHYFTKETAIATLEDAGYHVKRWFYTAAHIERTRPTRARRIAARPRKWLFRMGPDFAVRLLGGYSLLVLAE